MVITLRPKKPLTNPERVLILGFLRSRLASDLTEAAVDGGIHLTWTGLRELHIPQPDEAVITALDDLARAASLFEKWRSEAQTLLDSAFTDESAAGTRARIVGDGRNIRLRSDAAALLDDAGYTFRTRLPYPLAYRWREVEAAVSARSFKAAYEAILAAAEVLLCYAATVGLAVAFETEVRLGAVKMIHDKLQEAASGLGIGDWTTVLTQIRDGKAARRAPDGNPIIELRALLADSGTVDAVRRLTERRNDESHLRRADLLDLPAAVDISLADLTTLYQAASFLSDLPLIHVTAVHWDSFQKIATVSYRELIGDHPVVPTRTITYDQPGIEVESLYIIDGQRMLYLLRPFVIGTACPKCRNWSTFHIDGIANRKVSFKSLEHGHPMEDPTLDYALKHVGLLLFREKVIRSTTSRSELRRARLSGPYGLNCHRSRLTSYAITTVMGTFRERLAMQFKRPYRRIRSGIAPHAVTFRDRVSHPGSSLSAAGRSRWPPGRRPGARLSTRMRAGCSRSLAEASL